MSDSDFCTLALVLRAKANPKMKIILWTDTEEDAKKQREQVEQANGGARPFNLQVKSV